MRATLLVQISRRAESLIVREIPAGPGRLDDGIEPASEESDALDPNRRNLRSSQNVEGAPEALSLLSAGASKFRNARM